MQGHIRAASGFANYLVRWPVPFSLCHDSSDVSLWRTFDVLLWLHIPPRIFASGKTTRIAGLGRICGVRLRHPLGKAIRNSMPKSTATTVPTSATSEMRALKTLSFRQTALARLRHLSICETCGGISCMQARVSQDSAMISYE